ncbi:hypothetical protein EDD86DRAFT_213959 [Gorgonomyces haynaldii]|nr:hypothetical protein EDD86DRAFT_213959 [Gorgonomyces haynaldii]
MTDCAILQTMWPLFQTTRPLNAANCCLTQGVVCTGNTITTLGLEFTEASGIIPSDIGKLTGLQKLYLHSNRLKSGIPSSIGELVNLQEVSLYNNSLDGNIPETLGNLKQMKILYLDRNLLNGPIPSTLSQTSLERMTLDNNRLSGYVPQSLGVLKFIVLYMERNPDLKGPLPSEWSNLVFNPGCDRGAESDKPLSYYCCNFGDVCSAPGNTRPVHCGNTITCSEEVMKDVPSPVATPTAVPTTQPVEASGPNIGLIAGVAVGSIALICMTAFAILFFRKYQRLKAGFVIAKVDKNLGARRDTIGTFVGTTGGSDSNTLMSQSPIVPTSSPTPTTQEAVAYLPGSKQDLEPILYLPGMYDEMVSPNALSSSNYAYSSVSASTRPLSYQSIGSQPLVDQRGPTTRMYGDQR